MINRAWVVEQIADKYGDTDSSVGSCLFLIFEALYALPVRDRDDAANEFLSLLHGLELVRDEIYQPRHWVPAAQYHHLSDIGRVRPDLLHRDGWMLNGRVGVIVGKRRGDVIIRFDKSAPGAPDEYRGVITDFEVDISNIDSPQKGYHTPS